MPKHPSDYGSAPVWPALPTCQGKPRHSRDLAVLRGHALAEAAAPATGHPKWQSMSLITMKNATWKKTSIVVQIDSKRMSQPIRFSILKERQYYAIVWCMFKLHNPPQTSASSSLPQQMCLVVQGLQGQLPSQWGLMLKGPWWKKHQILNVPN